MATKDVRVSWEVRDDETGAIRRATIILAGSELPRRPAERDQAIADAMTEHTPEGCSITGRAPDIREA